MAFVVKPRKFRCTQFYEYHVKEWRNEEDRWVVIKCTLCSHASHKTRPRDRSQRFPASSPTPARQIMPGKRDSIWEHSEAFQTYPEEQLFQIGMRGGMRDGPHHILASDESFQLTRCQSRTFYNEILALWDGVLLFNLLADVVIEMRMLWEF